MSGVVPIIEKKKKNRQMFILIFIQGERVGRIHTSHLPSLVMMGSEVTH